MSFSKFNRRLHLYLGLLLLPWILMYGISSFTINHNNYFQKLYDDGTPQWTTRIEQPYDRPIPEDGDETTLAKEILSDLGIEGHFDVRRPSAERLQVFLSDFWSMTRVTYDYDKQYLRAEDRRFQWNHFLIWMHERSGYHRDSVLHDAWAVIVDLTCVGFLVFIASGLYMWWGLRQTRRWGSIALISGVASFLTLLLTL